jgi:hypothetical protein
MSADWSGLASAFQNIGNQKKADRRATSHEELQANTEAILGDVRMLQDRRVKLDPKSPTYQKDLSEIDANLHTARQAFTDLYHPEKNPGALEKLGGFITSHLGGQKEPPKTPGEARQRFDLASLDAAAAGPGQAAENPYVTKKRQMTEAGATPDQVERGVFGAEKSEAEAWKLVDVTMPDGSVKTVQHNEKNRAFADLAGNAIPPEQLQGARMVPKSAPKPIRAWVNKGGKTTSVLLDPATNKPIQGSENPDILPPSSMGGRISTGYYHFVDANGNVHQVQETHTSQPLRGGEQSGGGSSVPKTPGEAKSRVAAIAPKDTVLGHKETPVQAKAHKDYIDAVKLDSIANQVEKKPEDAVNQKRLAVALERISAGRFTTQALDYISKAGWAASAEQFWNSIDNGTLPGTVMRQLVEGAHQNLKASKAAWDESMKGSSEAGSSGGETEYIYAKDPQGVVHRNKKGATLPQGWTLTDAPTK